MSKILTHKVVLKRIGKDRTTIYRWVKAGNFPAPVEVQGGIGFYENEIEDWEASRPRVNYAPAQVTA